MKVDPNTFHTQIDHVLFIAKMDPPESFHGSFSNKYFGRHMADSELFFGQHSPIIYRSKHGQGSHN